MYSQTTTNISCLQHFLTNYLEKYKFLKLADANSTFADVKSITQLSPRHFFGRCEIIWVRKNKYSNKWETCGRNILSSFVLFSLKYELVEFIELIKWILYQSIASTDSYLNTDYLLFPFSFCQLKLILSADEYINRLQKPAPIFRFCINILWTFEFQFIEIFDEYISVSQETNSFGLVGIFWKWFFYISISMFVQNTLTRKFSDNVFHIINPY